MFTKRAFKTVRMSSIYPMPSCCWFCSVVGPASVITWKYGIPASRYRDPAIPGTFYTAGGNLSLLID